MATIKIKQVKGVYGTYHWRAECKKMVSSKGRWNDPDGALLECIKANEAKLRIHVEVERDTDSG